MKTYNVKEVAWMLNKPQSFVFLRARRLNLRPPEQTGQWYFTVEDVEKIKDFVFEKNRKRNSITRQISDITGYSLKQVIRVAQTLKLRLRADSEKIIKAIELHKTGEYTIKGIKARI